MLAGVLLLLAAVATLFVAVPSRAAADAGALAPDQAP